MWIQIHSIWIRIQDFGPIWIRIGGYTINFERKNKNNFSDKNFLRTKCYPKEIFTQKSLNCEFISKILLLFNSTFACVDPDRSVFGIRTQKAHEYGSGSTPLFSTLRHVLAFCFLIPVYQPDYSAVSDSSLLNIINLTYQGQKNISGRVICQHEQDESSKQFHIDHPSFTLSKR